MSIVTLATSLTEATDPAGNVYTYRPSGGSRLAVPLTTAWSFPPTCTDTVMGIDSCSPPYFQEVYASHGYYSPGVCYAGYEIGCIATVANVNYETVKQGETVAFCVPKNYQCGTKWSTPVTGFMSVSWAGPPGTATHLRWGTAIQIRWQSSDSAALGSLYVPSSVVASIVQGYAWSKATRPATSTSTAQSGVVTSGGLSPGHIAGIGVSVAAVVLGILVVAFIIFRRKRTQRRGASQSPTGTPEDGPAELPYDPEASGKGAELPAALFEPEPEELPARQVPSSTPSGAASAELAEATVQRIPELSGSLAPARTELPGGKEAPGHTGSSPTSPVGVVELSTTPPVSQQQSPNRIETVEGLMARQAQLEEKRQRLLQLQQIDEEQELIRQQLAALHGQQPTQRAEMP